MKLRTITTESSIWKFDMALKRYVRFPKNEVPGPTEVEYTLEWEPFDRLERFEDSVIVWRPVPLGTGRMRMTGVIVETDLTTEDLMQE